jgi:hypothetical protein
MLAIPTTALSPPINPPHSHIRVCVPVALEISEAIPAVFAVFGINYQRTGARLPRKSSIPAASSERKQREASLFRPCFSLICRSTYSGAFV